MNGSAWRFLVSTLHSGAIKTETESGTKRYRSKVFLCANCRYSVASPNVLGKETTWFIFPLTVLIRWGQTRDRQQTWLIASSSVIIFCLNARLPESPKWLVRQNRMEEAATAIKFYQGKECALSMKSEEPMCSNYALLGEIMTSYIKEKNLTVEDQISMREVWRNNTLREACFWIHKQKRMISSDRRS